MKIFLQQIPSYCKINKNEKTDKIAKKIVKKKKIQITK